jgi:selenide,water dikinase
VRSFALRACKELGVTVLENKSVAEIEPTRLRLSDGETIDTQLTVLATGYAPASILEKTDLTRSKDGSLHVDACLRSTNHPHVFAAGDCANITGLRIPKSGVYAVREGAVLANNLLAAFGGEAVEPYRHNRNALNLISLGAKRAIATRNGLSVAGDWVWRWKDSIDRKWMTKYAVD